MGDAYTVEETLVILYFTSMGLSTTAVAALLNHKLGTSRTSKAISYKRGNLKTFDGLWNKETQAWNLHAVGQNIATNTSDPKEFKKLIAFGPGEEVVWKANASSDCYLFTPVL